MCNTVIHSVCVYTCLWNVLESKWTLRNEFRTNIAIEIQLSKMQANKRSLVTYFVPYITISLHTWLFGILFSIPKMGNAKIHTQTKHTCSRSYTCINAMRCCWTIQLKWNEIKSNQFQTNKQTNELTQLHAVCNVHASAYVLCKSLSTHTHTHFVRDALKSQFTYFLHKIMLKHTC